MDIFYPVQALADWVTYTVFSVETNSNLGNTIDFFIYDTVKIFILLFVIALLMGLINGYFPVEKVRNFLSTRKMYGADYLLAALFGTVTPFCSCSSVPLFIGFVRGGIPLGVTLTFLISSPLVDSVVVAMLISAFGVKTTAIYVVSGVMVAIVAGYLLGKMSLEKYLTPWVRQNMNVEDHSLSVVHSSFMEKLNEATKETIAIMKSVAPYLVLGVGIGALIHGFIPIDFFQKYLTINSLLAVPIAVLIGVPIYVNAAGIIPIAQVLVAKGISIGVVLAFMMAAVGLSIPSAVMLKKVMTTKLLAIFFGVVTLSIIILGYIYTLVL